MLISKYGRLTIIAGITFSLFFIVHRMTSSLFARKDLRIHFGDSSSSGITDAKTDDVPELRDPVCIVAAKTKNQDTSWIAKLFPKWDRKIYVVDDPTAPLRVPVNKGREGMAYLRFVLFDRLSDYSLTLCCYIIDHYDRLPDFVFFIHASRFQWHNDDPDFDQYAVLERTNLTYVREQGYASLRCAWHIGCPHEIQPEKDLDLPDKPTSRAFLQAYKEVMPDRPVPEMISAPCCAQFAVIRDRIIANPKEQYIRWRDWLVSTPLDDDISGRIFEYLWHVIFGKNAFHCPDMATCYCNLFNICGLSCDHERCETQWHFPPSLALPSEWPKIGWNGEERNFTGPMIKKGFLL